MKDPYKQTNGTLVNKLGITDSKELKQAEEDISYAKLLNVERVFEGKFEIELLKSIHTHLFEDIYYWAGELRKVSMFKEEPILFGASLEYAQPKEIKKKTDKILDEMNATNWGNMKIDELVEVFTGDISKLWRVHPFRDGNTRTILAFAYIFAKEHGFEIDMTTILDDLKRERDPKTGKIIKWCIRDKLVLASLDKRDYPEPQALQNTFKKAIINGGKPIKKDVGNDIDER